MRDDGETGLVAEREVVALGEVGWFVRDDFVDAAVVTAARGECDSIPTRAAAMSRGASHRIEPEQRGDRAAWIDPASAPPALRTLCDRFEALRVSLNAQAWLGLRRFDVQLASYPGGGARYARHLDSFRSGTPGEGRRLTAIVYLNDRWSPLDGGELRLHVEPAPVDVAPVGGRLVAFASERVEHEVLPARSPRWAITAWYYG